MNPHSKKRVLIVDDSAVVRQTISEILSAHPQLEVMGTANDPFQAAERLRKEWPDVIVLDVEMPRMDGITFLRRLMAQRPVPVVICSTLVGEGSRTHLAALEAGAVDLIQKPNLSTRRFLEESTVRIQDAVLAAAHARMRRGPATPTAKLTADAVLAPGARTAMAQTTHKAQGGRAPPPPRPALAWRRARRPPSRAKVLPCAEVAHDKKVRRLRATFRRAEAPG